MTGDHSNAGAPKAAAVIPGVKPGVRDAKLLVVLPLTYHMLFSRPGGGLLSAGVKTHVRALFIQFKN